MSLKFMWWFCSSRPVTRVPKYNATITQVNWSVAHSTCLSFSHSDTSQWPIVKFIAEKGTDRILHSVVLHTRYVLKFEYCRRFWQFVIFTNKLWNSNSSLQFLCKVAKSLIQKLSTVSETKKNCDIRQEQMKLLQYTVSSRRFYVSISLNILKSALVHKPKLMLMSCKKYLLHYVSVVKQNKCFCYDGSYCASLHQL